MGSGIVDAEALLRADLDQGRERESIDHLPNLADSEMTSVASLIAETIGPNAVESPGLDWHRFGPELATALLTRSATLAQTRPESPNGQAVTDHLKKAFANKELKAWLKSPSIQPGSSRESARQ